MGNQRNTKLILGTFVFATWLMVSEQCLATRDLVLESIRHTCHSLLGNVSLSCSVDPFTLFTCIAGIT